MAENNPMHTAPKKGGVPKKWESNVPLQERLGLTTEEAEAAVAKWGYNEIPVVEVPLWYIFLIQFTGTMPYMLELACILSLVVLDYIDFAIIFTMVMCNGYLGFHEELKAKESLAELTSKMEQKIAILRDGSAEHMNTRFLVPGDVVLLVGGCAIPADIEWFEGDVLSIDTAALTGEPLPRKYPSDQYGALILQSCTVRAGEAYGIVRKTGINTEVGSSQADIMKDKATAKVSVFEERVLYSVKVIILISLVDVFTIFLIQGFARNEFKNGFNDLLLTCLSIIIASVPVALPLVLQVTMALGAGTMASDFNAVVTSLPALQDISSMSILCSDKTGTLTTAHITIQADSVWTCGDEFTKEDVALYGVLSSNRDKKEDAIDRSVVQHFDRVMPNGIPKTQEFTKIRSVGFNPIYKRVLYEYSHPKLGRISIAKGLPAKVIDTADGGEDDAEDQFKVDGLENIKSTVHKVDFDFSKKGYKTLGVSVKFGDGPWKFVGILPMLDPPRHDSALTVKNLRAAGIGVKMITGDHLNIAKETCKLIGMGQNIHTGESTRDPGPQTAELVWNSDGFAQVLPRDKREVIMILRNKFNVVVGMTGDGVNDAPALSAAQCGVAVDDATDAAKNAAAIILTTPGLSAIYSAVVESRRIFKKLKAYVTYRFAATIQIVIVLTFLIFVSNCPIESLYVIILALFNDLTMLPIAYDRQTAASLPENPDVTKMLFVSGGLGVVETILSLMFAYGADGTGLFQSDLSISTCGKQAQAAIWLQMFIACEILIFSARASSYFWCSLAPSVALFCSVIMGCIICCLLALFYDYFGGLPFGDVCLIWVYDILGLFIVDAAKVQMLIYLKENTEVLPDYTPPADPPEHGHGASESAPAQITKDSWMDGADEESRPEAATRRMSEWALDKDENIVNVMRQSAVSRRNSMKDANEAFSRSNTARDSTTSGMLAKYIDTNPLSSRSVKSELARRKTQDPAQMSSSQQTVLKKNAPSSGLRAPLMTDNNSNAL